MEEMVEPDRTIMIVSIIGLVVIWGSFFTISSSRVERKRRRLSL